MIGVWYSRGDEYRGEMPHRGDKGGVVEEGECGGEESTVKQRV